MPGSRICSPGRHKYVHVGSARDVHVARRPGEQTRKPGARGRAIALAGARFRVSGCVSRAQRVASADSVSIRRAVRDMDVAAGAPMDGFTASRRVLTESADTTRCDRAPRNARQNIRAPANAKRSTQASSDLDHLEGRFRRRAIRTAPVLRNVGPRRTRRDARVRVSRRLVVNETAIQAHPGFHRCVTQ